MLLKFVTMLSVAICPLLNTMAYAADENAYKPLQEAAISSAAGTPWNAARQIEIVKKSHAVRLQLLSNVEKKTYPISEDDLKKIYENAKSETVPFFAYSSMIDIEAGAVKAISATAAATQTPAIAFGIQRTFNRAMPAATVEGGWGALKRPNDLAILNAFEKEDAVANGVLFQLPINDLLILTKREVGYDLIPVLATTWDGANDQKEPEIFLAYTFLAPVSETANEFTDMHVNPIPAYVNYLQKGLDVIGNDFKAMWWNTTYLADQKTLVSQLPYNNVDMKAKDVK